MSEQDFKTIRLQKLEQLEKTNIEPYPNNYKISNSIKEIKENKEKLEKEGTIVKTAGRLMLMRMHGKAGFSNIKDDSGSIQIYIKLDFVGEEKFNIFKLIDVGDIIGVEGPLFTTHTGEATIKVDNFVLLAKSLLPLPEKWHGLSDIEIRYRQRYVDLIMNDEVKESFKLRSKITQLIRGFLAEQEFLEVETPMMQPVYGGAAARPFITHHNTLDMDLYLRIAPELYLKRLIVGGFSKVFEMNRNFRNEGISTRHNPEFTMLELYQAYADYNDMMVLCENLICFIIKEIKGNLEFDYQGLKLNFNQPWARIKYLDAINHYTKIDFNQIKTVEQAEKEAKKIGIETEKGMSVWAIANEIFEEKVEEHLIQPTFILDYPKELSPLAKGIPGNPDFVERFEPYIAGREVGNAFTELNDPIEQRKRFEDQQKKRDKGDLEAHPMDWDFITALEYGMPPTGGLGIGIDRIIMVLINTNSIRDTILFPLLKAKTQE